MIVGWLLMSPTCLTNDLMAGSLADLKNEGVPHVRDIFRHKPNKLLRYLIRVERVRVDDPPRLRT